MDQLLAMFRGILVSYYHSKMCNMSLSEYNGLIDEIVELIKIRLENFEHAYLE